jgi:hypothetical protein
MFKKLIAKIRDFFTVAFARRQYYKAKQVADKQAAKTGKAWYVCLSPFDDKKLRVIDRKAFRRFKSRYIDSVIRAYTRAGLIISVDKISPTTMEDVKRGCFYSTAITDAKEIEMRRKAFIEWVLELSENKKTTASNAARNASSVVS